MLHLVPTKVARNDHLEIDCQTRKTLPTSKTNDIDATEQKWQSEIAGLKGIIENLKDEDQSL